MKKLIKATINKVRLDPSEDGNAELDIKLRVRFPMEYQGTNLYRMIYQEVTNNRVMSALIILRILQNIEKL